MVNGIIVSYFPHRVVMTDFNNIHNVLNSWHIMLTAAILQFGDMEIIESSMRVYSTFWGFFRGRNFSL